MRFLLTIGLLMVSLPVYAQRSPEEQIREAVRALPEALREGATVLGYDAEGERVTLREGSNSMTCWADDPNPSAPQPFYVVCFPASLEPLLSRRTELVQSGVTPGPALFSALDAEVKSGKLAVPEFAVRYTLRGGTSIQALPLTIIHVPYATPSETGFSSEADNFRPWLMVPGTVLAHIMVPGQ